MGAYHERGIYDTYRTLLACAGEDYLRQGIGKCTSLPSAKEEIDLKKQYLNRLWIVLIVFFAAPACTTTSQARGDAQEPRMEKETVDFSPVFGDTSVSDSFVFAAARDVALNAMMLSPNTVLETSRSSLAEPDVEGPESNDPETPHLEHAMGYPIKTHHSSVLLQLLDDYGIRIIAPVMSFRWYSYACWNTDECRIGTWVERMLHMHRNYAEEQGEQDGGSFFEFEDPEDYEEGHPGDTELATTAFGVRSLGIYRQEMTVSVIPTDTGWTVEPGYDEDVSVCQPIRVRVPLARFEGEILELREGNMVARIQETKSLVPPDEVEQSVNPYEFEPETATDYRRRNRVTGTPDRGSSYEYIAEWERTFVLCDNLREVVEHWDDDLMDDVDEYSLVREMVQGGLEPLLQMR